MLVFVFVYIVASNDDIVVYLQTKFETVLHIWTRFNMQDIQVCSNVSVFKSVAQMDLKGVRFTSVFEVWFRELEGKI